MAKKEKSGIGVCSICEREKPLTFHHLIPKKNHKNKWFRKNFELGEMRNSGIYVCRDCHNKIHQVFGEKELGKTYNKRELITAHPEIKKFAVWIRKQK